MNFIARLYYLLRTKLFRENGSVSYSTGYFPQLVRHETVKIIDTYISPLPDTLLEVGCGEGLFCRKFAQTHPQTQVVGIDHRPAIIYEAEQPGTKLANLQYTVAQGQHLPYQTGQYTCVVCINTILNVPIKELPALFTELFRVCQPKGYLVFDVRNAECFWLTWQYKLAKIYDPYISVPLITYTNKQVIKLLSPYKYKLIVQKYVGFPKNSFSPILMFVVQKNTE